MCIGLVIELGKICIIKFITVNYVENLDSLPGLWPWAHWETSVSPPHTVDPQQNYINSITGADVGDGEKMFGHVPSHQPWRPLAFGRGTSCSVLPHFRSHLFSGMGLKPTVKLRGAWIRLRSDRHQLTFYLLCNNRKKLQFQNNVVFTRATLC